MVMGMGMCTTSTMPRADWAAKIYRKEVFATNAVDANVTWPPFAKMSADLMLSSDIVFLGVPTERVPGETVKEKRENLL